MRTILYFSILDFFNTFVTICPLFDNLFKTTNDFIHFWTDLKRNYALA